MAPPPGFARGAGEGDIYPTHAAGKKISSIANMYGHLIPPREGERGEPGEGGI